MLLIQLSLCHVLKGAHPCSHRWSGTCGGAICTALGRRGEPWWVGRRVQVELQFDVLKFPLNLTIIFTCLADKSIFIHICRINVSIHSSYLPGAVTEIFHVMPQVYTTAGREEKRQYLRDLGVKYITSSRNGPLVITHVVRSIQVG